MLPVYILAGGKSSRFGSDKAIAAIDGKPLIVRLHSELERSLGSRATIVAKSVDSYRELGLPVIADPFPHKGPVAGIATALEHLENQFSALDDDSLARSTQPESLPAITNAVKIPEGWCLIVACDLLEWHTEWLERLIEGIKPTVSSTLTTTFEYPPSRACCFAMEDKDGIGRNERVWNPFPGLYHRSSLAIAREVGRSLHPSMQSLLNSPEMKTIKVAFNSLPTIRSANTPQELHIWLDDPLRDQKKTK